MYLADDSAAAMASALRRGYGVAVEALERLPVGQGTLNHRARSAAGSLFVKQYPRGTDLDAEAAAIAQSEHARHHGVPAAALVPARDGAAIATLDGIAISVWQWMPGVMAHQAAEDCAAESGAALGRIHRLFTDVVPRAGSGSRCDQWLLLSLPTLEARIEQLEGLIAERVASGADDAFDRLALEQLAERRAQLAHAPGLLASLPPLRRQVLHGDYSPVNLLVQGGRLSAVLDFRPPDAFFLAYELGRIAFFPERVTASGWQASARALVAAYLDAFPRAPRADVRVCGRFALLQLLRSFYGVSEHYLRPALLPDSLDRFWQARHAAVTQLLNHRAEVDDLLATLTS